MLKRKYIYISIVILALSLVVGYNYIYKEHRNISEEKAAYVITSTELIKEYVSSVEEATKKYLDKTIQISGKITEIDKDNFTINSTIVCYADNSVLEKIKKNVWYVVKGRNIGYDELLEFIKLDQVIIIKP